ncbi:MAG: glycosyltransferase [Pirellulales bacterium]|nr:glycosyltransferase [Pirellulales bacterium]
MDQPLTVVLPMYNRVRLLRCAVLDIFELAHEIDSPLAVIVVDDGSVDETYETACELARVYPQLKVLRQPTRRGLAAALALVRNNFWPEIVVVHDGLSSIDAADLKLLLESRTQVTDAHCTASAPGEQSIDAVGSRRFASLHALQEGPEKTHRGITSFSWIRLEKPLIPRRASASLAPAFSAIVSPELPVSTY